VQLGPWHKPSRGPTQYSGGRSHRPSVSCRYLSTRSVSSRRGAPTMLALPARLARTGRRSAGWMERQRSRASGRSGGWRITTQWDTRWQPRVPHATFAPGPGSPLPHFHRDWDETARGPPPCVGSSRCGRLRVMLRPVCVHVGVGKSGSQVRGGRRLQLGRGQCVVGHRTAHHTAGYRRATDRRTCS
jgi:hypothetical protein